MRNIAFAIIVLAVTIPVMGDVNITMTRDASNKVTIGYQCTSGELVRAFALKIDVNNGAFLVDSDEFAGDPNHDDYYVCPGSISFTVEDGNTVISDFGNPIADQDPCGGVLEIASLYADADPCHTSPPASANDLAVFYLDCNAVGFTVGTITLSEDAQRGGVILEDPNEAFTLNLPSPMTICEDCLVVGTYCGGVQITQTMYNNWISAGANQVNKDPSWCHGGHFAGDADLNCVISATDLIGPGLPNFKAAFLKSCGVAGYAPECDTNNDCSISSTDLIGGGTAVCVPNGCGVKPNFLRTLPNCP